MKILYTNTKIYENIRVNYWIKLCNATVDPEIPFGKFILDYGGIVYKAPESKILSGDVCGIVPGVDEIHFPDDEDYTLFVLRWS